MIRHSPLAPEHRPLIADLLASLSAFTEDERAVALELVDVQLARPGSDEYRFALSFLASSRHDAGESNKGAERLAGYICYGRTPMTQSTYDLYWIATSPEFARAGVARGLISTMESEIAQEGGGIVRVETGSREGHGAAVHFYDALGFARAARIEDFYAPGDDLLIFTKRIRGAEQPASVPATDEAALYDAAFGYRDYAAERDFLLACARRFGDREVCRVLAWACGPARHLSAFAEIGIAGIGVDASEAMIAYAQSVLRSRPPSPEIRFIRAALTERPDIATVSIIEGDGGSAGKPPSAPLLAVDLSFVPLSAVHLLATPEALIEHLRIAASLLAPGGVHIIEATHPGDLAPTGVSRTEWTEVRGDLVIDARFRMHIDRMTPERVVPVTLEVVASTKRNGGSGSPPKMTVLRQEDPWYIPDMAGWRAAVLAVPELKLVATLGDFNIEVPFEHSAAWRLILVLKRT